MVGGIHRRQVIRMNRPLPTFMICVEITYGLAPDALEDWADIGDAGRIEFHEPENLTHIVRKHPELRLTLTESRGEATFLCDVGNGAAAPAGLGVKIMRGAGGELHQAFACNFVQEAQSDGLFLLLALPEVF